MTGQMRTGILAFLLFVPLCACGPKEISTSSDEEQYTRTSVSAAEQMRYPVYGTDANQRMLFENNKMDTMVLKQQLMRNAANPAKPQNPAFGPLGISPEDPAYRAVPKERSPFRQ